MDADDRAERLNFTLADYVNDVRQALTAINADNLNPTSQSQLDQLMRKTDALTGVLARGEDPEVLDDENEDGVKKTAAKKAAKQS